MGDWTLQEVLTNWTTFAIGWVTYRRGGWDYDERHIFFGPWTFVLLNDREMRKANS